MYREALRRKDPMRWITFSILAALSLAAAGAALTCYGYALRSNIAFKLYSRDADLNVVKTLAGLFFAVLFYAYWWTLGFASSHFAAKPLERLLSQGNLILSTAAFPSLYGLYLLLVPPGYL